MSIPANVLERRGYRLPTEPEWEYACRAGAITSRSYGASLDLLGAYAWYQANSKEHSWACGSLLPNDLGLFDMLGNEYEWVHDSNIRQMPQMHGIFNDTTHDVMPLLEKHPRLLRGGSFYVPRSWVRSAIRVVSAPADRNASFGFRPSRTYP
jgi:formylglycine-generating enzyme required for sulfatase activity